MTWGLGTSLLVKIHPVTWVTGAGGFLGSYLCEALLKRGANVLAIDNWRTGIVDNLSHLISEKNFQILEHDITQPFPKNIPVPNYIFHLERLGPETPDTSLLILREYTRGTEVLLEEACKNRAKFLLVQGIDSMGEASRFAQKLVSEFVKTRGLNGRIIKLGHLYGPKMLMLAGDPLADIFRSVLYKKPILKSEQRVNPLFVQDAVEGILTATFGAGTRGKVFSFITREVSLYELGALAEKLNQGNSFPYFDEDNVPMRTTDSNLIFAPTPFVIGAAKTLKFFKENPNRAKIPLEVGQKLRSVDSSKRHFPKKLKFFIFTALFLFALWLVVLPLLLLGTGMAALELTRRSFLNGSFEGASRFSAFAYSAFSFSAGNFAKFELMPVVGDSVVEWVGRIQKGAALAQIGSRSAQIGILGEKVLRGMFTQDFPSSALSVSRLGLEIETLSRNLDFLKVGEDKASFLGKLNIDTSMLSAFAKLAKQGEQLLGFAGKQTYLMLLQNNMELRPTGGFIGSFGLITMENGKITNIEIQDVYTADGQLTGHVEPPQKLKEHLGEATWFLRDSNWDPDFPTSAERAEWFLDKELAKNVDGVIALDLEAIRGLIKVIGPLNIPDFSTTVDAVNFYEKTQGMAESNFFPGSTQKRDFLTAVARVLGENLKGAGDKLFLVGQSIASSLASKHILISLHKQEAQQAIVQLGWDGGIKNVKCQIPNTKCLEDYLFLVEANLGVNKANYYLSRSYLLDVTMKENGLLHELTTSYVNKARKGEVGLRYKNYLRVYTPLNSRVQTAAIADPATGEKTLVNIDKSQEHDKSVFGMLVEIPAGESRQISLSWETGFGVSDTANLAFFWQKQAGTGEAPVALRFRYPENLSVRFLPVPSLTQAGNVSYNTVLGGDLQVTAVWTKLP